MIINNKQVNEKTLYILMGFKLADLNKESNKLFGLQVEQSLNQLYELDSKEKREIIRSIRSKKNDYYWVTPEEYYIFGNAISYDFDEIIMIKNNLYQDMMPYHETIENIDTYYEDNYLNKRYQANNFDLFTNEIYGFITEIEHEYYIFYNFNIDDEIKIETYLNDTKEININIIEEDMVNRELLELKEDRDIINLVNKLTKNNENVGILFLNLDDFDEKRNYLEALNHEFDGRIAVYINQSSKRLIANEQSYLNILKKYWKYDSFKMLPFYKDTTSREIIKISQAQIIDDIVTQTEKGLNNELPRDIFITSSTGAGKSLMFQIPALYIAEKYKDRELKPITLIISPLIGLMNDQTTSLENRNIHSAKTINSGISQAEKEKISRDVKEGKIDLLYISSETLINRGDIKQLIGDRPIGLFIVDEAHIITTWGKSFRPDYWYMGSYVQRLRKKFNFPIVTFTATAIVEGKNSMLDEIKSTLNLSSVIKYIGTVRKDNMILQVENYEKVSNKKTSNDSLKIKNELTLKMIKENLKNNEKVLIYFPTIREINSFSKHIMTYAPKSMEHVTVYYGRLTPHEKNQNFEDFKSGKKKVILATKAFGMGIDVPDINRVYHYGMTGNLLDFLQEIGRAARDEKMLGVAQVDYLKKDFNEMKKMNVLSALKKSELIGVMEKISKVYKANHFKRDIIINPKEFEYIFTKGESESANSDPINKVKLALLTIENDFKNRVKYPPFVSRPGEVNSIDYILVNDRLLDIIRLKKNEKYFEYVGDCNGKFYKYVYSFKTAEYWKKYYSEMSYPQFKYFFATNDERLKSDRLLRELNIAVKFDVEVLPEIHDIESVSSKLLSNIEEVLREFAVKGSFFDEEILQNRINKTPALKEYKNLALLIINSLIKGSDINNLRLIDVQVDGKYKLSNNYQDLFDKFRYYNHELFKKVNEIIVSGSKDSYYVPKTNQVGIDNYMIILGLLDATHMLTYEVSSGEVPTLSLRINSLYQLEAAVKKPKQYRNEILNQQYFSHKVGIELLKYIFTHEIDEVDNGRKYVYYTQWFWNIAEDYFFGKIPDEVMEAVRKKD
ncbi:helicase-related protein [Macrococcoides bohemicum]|uniref:helicase-related protein n=1 Tax=Macrococcoides bohemicum TaxID=1903056 RepID=UPI00289E7F60|nr:helicase-related protein [Macrococcus bohemicus]